jgi:hypothetical protein
VAVDELAGTVALTCARCRLPGSGPANRQVVRTCRASIAAFRAVGEPVRAVESSGHVLIAETRTEEGQPSPRASVPGSTARAA